MERLPATNRWPKWASQLLWGVGALAVLGIGLCLPILWSGFTAFLGVIHANADSAAAIALLLQALIFLIGALYAHRQLHATRAISARTNTLQLIFEEHRDSTVANHRAIFRSVRDDDSGRLEDYADLKEYKQKIREKWEATQAAKALAVVHLRPTGEVDALAAVETSNTPNKEGEWQAHWQPLEKDWVEKRKAVSAVLNRYESFAIGIGAKAIDEEMYKLWWRTTLIDDWYVFRPLILKLQERNPRAYIEFQAIAEKWQKETTKELQDQLTRRGRSTW